MQLLQHYFPHLSERQLSQFAALGALYREWNQKINVISRRDIDNLYLHHVLHSLALARCNAFAPGSRVLDLGTGGGFPGIPLAILYPDSKFTLIDGTGKKIRVAQEVCSAIGLENCQPLHRRGEDERGRYHYVVSRAVMPLPQLVALVRKNVLTSLPAPSALAPGILCLKGGDLSQELQPYQGRVQCQPISQWFAEEWFLDKYAIYLPL